MARFQVFLAANSTPQRSLTIGAEPISASKAKLMSAAICRQARWIGVGCKSQQREFFRKQVLFSFNPPRTLQPYISCSIARDREGCVTLLSSKGWVPKIGSVAGEEEDQKFCLPRWIILTLVGIFGALDVLVSVPALASPVHHKFDDITTTESVAHQGCPIRGRAAPVSVLLRYPRGFQQGYDFQLLNSEFMREVEGESISYGQIVADRDGTSSKKDMYTSDAWMGMRRLQQYVRLVESMEGKEKLCVECARNRRLLEQVWQTVSNDYYDHYGSFSQSQWAGELYRTLSKSGGLLRTKAETYVAIKEMVANLGDKYSSFLNPNEYRLAIHRPLPSEVKYLAHQYTGVGIELGERSSNGGFMIVAPLAGSPAEEVGILGGEELIAVDGMAVKSFSRDEAVAFLRGPVGSTVALTVASQNLQATPRNLQVERRALPLPPLQMRMLDAGNGRVVAYLRLHYFTHEGTKRMASAIREGEALGVDSYILDLRNNPGGVFEEAIAMAALWLDCKGCDVTETVRSNTANIEDLVYTVGHLPEDVFLKHPGTLTHAPLAIIVNRDSASASEVIMGALHDNHRVVTVGERTFGKGVVQYYFPMDDGSGLKLTVAKYLTPARYDISEQGGLEPDKVCSDYPHANSLSDICIDEALGMLANQETKAAAGPLLTPMPYRWVPYSERRLWASGSY